MDLEWALQWGWSVLNACLYLLMQPFYYISILIVALGYRRQMLLERKLFHTKMHSWASETWRVVWSGLLAGMALSVLGMFVSVHLNPASIVCLWVATLLLMLVRVRYLCLAYSVGLLGVVQFFLNVASGWQPVGALGTSVTAIRGLDIPALLVLVAVLHVAEALLVRWQGGKLPLRCLSRANGEDWLAVIVWKTFGPFRCYCWYRLRGIHASLDTFVWRRCRNRVYADSLANPDGLQQRDARPATTTEGGTHFEPLAPIQCGFTSVELAGGMVESADIVSSVILFSGS